MAIAAKSADHRYALLGSGRLARHLAHYFRTEGLQFDSWARRTAIVDAPRALEEVVAPCTHVLILISDDAIAPFIRDHGFLREKVLVHCSGSLSLDAAHGVHPLMTFADELYAPAVYRAIPFVTDADGPEFAELFPGLPNPSYPLARDKKALYHAYCVASGNFTGLLWEEVFRAFEADLGLPKSVLLPYMDRVFANLAAADGVVTGPLVRKDHETIRRNLAALDGKPLQDVYKAFLDLQGIALPSIDPE
jgi:predicted short-subunit dehydrogenase-like oxidoreductase (DUF2520 family)